MLASLWAMALPVAGSRRRSRQENDMTRSRGEPPEGMIDREYPFQVALLACQVSWRFENVLFLSQKLGCWRLNHTLLYGTKPRRRGHFQLMDA
jgi:hypothetical protein